MTRSLFSGLLASLLMLLNHQHMWVVAQADDLCKQDVTTILPPPYNNITGLSCKGIWNNFILRYLQNNDNVMTIIVSTVYTSGWVGMGFSKDGMMVGSSAMVGWIDHRGKSTLKQYYLRGVERSQVIPDSGELKLTTILPIIVLSGATIYMAFQIQFQYHITQQPILLAFGTEIPQHHYLTEHVDKTTVRFNFAADSGETDGTSYSVDNDNYVLRSRHGILGIVGWGVLIPLGAIIARYCKHKDPLWYYIHMSLQLVGFIIGLTTVLLGMQVTEKMGLDDSGISIHRGIGIFVLVLSILQILALFLRPNKEAKIRKYWNWYHRLVGWVAIFFAAMNIELGIEAAGGDFIWQTVYIFATIFLLISVVILEVLLRLTTPNHTIPPAFQMNPI